jgi:hypothetical protein
MRGISKAFFNDNSTDRYYKSIWSMEERGVVMGVCLEEKSICVGGRIDWPAAYKG